MKKVEVIKREGLLNGRRNGIELSFYIEENPSKLDCSYSESND